MANNYGGNFPSFDEYLNQHSVRRDRQRYPFYTDNADYNTNAKSYYDDLSRKNKLIEILAKRIWEYDEELAKRFEEWDKNLEELPEDVKKLLIEWMEDGTLDEIINENIFNDLNDELTSLKSYLNRIKGDMDEKLSNIVSANPVDIVDSETELKEKYPNGVEGIIVVRDNGYYYYYQNNKWNKGSKYLQELVYPLVEENGHPENLNLNEAWINDADIANLSTGIYTAYLQSENLNNNYPVTRNIPSEIKGYECLIKVFKYGLNEDDRRTDFEIITNTTSDIYRTSMTVDGELLEWGSVLKFRSSHPLQQYRLTYYGGDIQPLTMAHEDIARSHSNTLNVPITSLKTGFYYGGIGEPANSIDRKLPKDIIYNQMYNFEVYRTKDGRVNIYLNANYTGMSWICYTGANESSVIWKRLDVVTDEIERAKLLFGYKVNKISNDNYKSLIIADTHIEHVANTNQIAVVNAKNMKDLYDIDDMLHYNDATIHLGDWIDGNFPKDDSIFSMVKLSKNFFSKPNRFAIYGNHDFNGQWDGFSGENGEYKYSLERLFEKEDLTEYYTPKDKKDYYYYDDNQKYIRAIYLNSFDISYKTDDNDELILDPLNTRGFGNEQIEWLLQTLNHTPSNYNVVIYSHDTFNNVFDDGQYYNGDLVRKICEAYQDKTDLEVFTSGIDETSEVYDYYQIETEFDFKNANGKILGVINGHRHIDKSISKNGIRYISLLCARAEAGDSEEKPPRNYHDETRNAISFLEFDLNNEEINLLRFGAGIDRTFKMFE